jgi:dTDP-4-amino-4,6-dideoxygalactose transaminase
VGEFETAFAAATGAKQAVACASGTSAIHLLLASLDLPQGARAVAPAITFLATATAAAMAGLDPVLCDVDPYTGLMTADTLAPCLDGAGVILPVHMGGALCDMEVLAPLARSAGAHIVEDACHAVGGHWADGTLAGSAKLSDGATFSLHPVKTLAAGEGGMITLNDTERAERLRRLRNHGVSRDATQMSQPHSFDTDGSLNPWTYEQLELGFSLRMNEMEAALGLSQLRKLPRFAKRRRALSARYDQLLAPLGPHVRPSTTPQGQSPCRHLYTVLIDFEALGRDRAQVMRALTKAGIGTQVHYIPLYRQPWFIQKLGQMRLPGAEAWYARVLALPLFPAMADEDVDRVVAALGEALKL